jgi:SAM-dependent methyltransferase
MDVGINRFFAEQYEANWYLASRADVLASIIAPLCAAGPQGRLVDFGAGVGSILARIHGDVIRIGIEGEWELASVGRGRHGLDFVVADLARGIPLVSHSADVIVALDVIEHLDDDGAALAEIFRVLKPTGTLVVSVPAFQRLWSRHDELHHHKRRYSKQGLRDVVTASGFSCTRVTYFNCLLFPLVVASRMLERLSLSPRDAATDYEKPPQWLAGLLRRVFGFEARLVPYLDLPVGVSLLAVATKS